jgi:hypothetical protein
MPEYATERPAEITIRAVNRGAGRILGILEVHPY